MSSDETIKAYLIAHDVSSDSDADLADKYQRQQQRELQDTRQEGVQQVTTSLTFNQSPPSGSHVTLANGANSVLKMHALRAAAAT